MAIHEDPRREIAPELDYQISIGKKVVKHLDVEGTTYIEYSYEDVHVFKDNFQLKQFELDVSSASPDSVISDIMVSARPNRHNVDLACDDISDNFKQLMLNITPPLQKADAAIDLVISYMIRKGTCIFLEDFGKFYPGDTSNLEDTSAEIRRICGELLMVVNFLPNYPVTPRAKRSFMGHETELGSPQLAYSRETDSVSLKIVGPKVGMRYVIEWTPTKREQFLQR